ncbi:MAG: cyclase family protein [Terriglobales bacterium]
MAVALLLFAQRRPAQTHTEGYREVVDLTHSGALMVRGEHLDAAAYGTRLDAPIEREHGEWTPEPVSPDRLVAPLAVLDVSAKAAADPDYQVSLADVARWEEIHGQIPAGAVVIARTGWKTPEVLSKTPQQHPAYSTDAVEFLARAREVYGIGIDAPALDLANAPEMPVRRYLGEQHIYGLANVANLDEAPAAGAVVVVAPTVIRNAAGAPARVLALVK